MNGIGKTLNWWFKAGDRLLEAYGVPNNAGNLKFRANMRVIWFVWWASIMAITSGVFLTTSYVMVLWGAAAWYKPYFK